MRQGLILHNVAKSTQGQKDPPSYLVRNDPADTTPGRNDLGPKRDSGQAVLTQVLAESPNVFLSLYTAIGPFGHPTVGRCTVYTPVLQDESYKL